MVESMEPEVAGHAASEVRKGKDYLCASQVLLSLQPETTAPRMVPPKFRSFILS